MIEHWMMDAAIAWTANNSTPSPTPTFDPNKVTPGVLGFSVIAIFFVICALLVWNLIMRVSRMSHRSQVRAELALEKARAEGRDLGANDPDAEGIFRQDDAPRDGEPGAETPKR